MLNILTKLVGQPGLGFKLFESYSILFHNSMMPINYNLGKVLKK